MQLALVPGLLARTPLFRCSAGLRMVWERLG
jgi:hypothetical protein